MATVPSDANHVTIRAALETVLEEAYYRYKEYDLDDLGEAVRIVRAHLDTLAAGQEWQPATLELYEYPDGKTGLVYTSSDGYGRAQLRYLQDADTDTPKETIIILPEHIRLCQREPRPATGEATGVRL